MGSAAAASIVFPVRFVAAGQATQTTSRFLGLEEIGVRCLGPPPVGTRVSMALYLPGSPVPEVVVAEVSESQPAAGRAADAGFRARFLAMHPDGRHRIDALLQELERRGPPPRTPASKATPIAEALVTPLSSALVVLAASEKPALTVTRPAAPAPVAAPRVFPRYATRFKVRFNDALEFIEQYADNISRGGVFIETLDPPELERSVSVVLELPDGGAPISAAALVVHRVTFEEASRYGERAGCGVQFLDTSDGFHERIEEYLAKLANTPEDL
jgi:uncharacterized protein (TIGR02266 family)